MYNLIERSQGSSEEATETRQAMANRIQKAMQMVETAAAEVKTQDNTALNKEKRAQGKALYFSALENVKQVPFDAVAKQAQHFVSGSYIARVEDHIPAWQAVAAVHAATSQRRGMSENSPYFVEGIIQGLRQQLFTIGVKASASAYTDDFAGGHNLCKLLYAPQCSSAAEDVILREFVDGAGHLQSPMRGIDRAGFGYSDEMVATTEDGVAFLHGFKTADDVAALRWTSARAGAVVKELTGNDACAKRAADELRGVYNFTFDFYPNDCGFGAVYESFYNSELSSCLGSCMAGKERGHLQNGSYHPCTVYGSAYHGSGDNGLVMVVAKSCGIQTGRGILNVRTGQIVRWYGEHKALVQLNNTMGIHEDGAALKDSWLALITDGDEFVHPYVDGCYEYGSIDHDLKRVWLGCSSDDTADLASIKCTSCLDTRNRHECCYSDVEYPEDAMTYQPITGTWIADCNIDRAEQCAVTGEYLHICAMHYTTIRGDRLLVWNDADWSDWINLGDGIGWVADEDVDDYYYDEETGLYYNDNDYADLIAEREAEQEAEDDAA